MHIAILFEFPSLNGGEHSMLTVLSRLARQQGWQFTALAPPTGLLADELRQLEIPIVDFEVRDALNNRRPMAESSSELQQILADVRPDVLHANSLSMSRLLGRVAEHLPAGIRWTGHLRDIMRLSARAIADLNRLDAVVAVSNATRSFHMTQGLDGKLCSVAYNGVDPSRFHSRPRAEARASILPDVPPNAQVLLNVGQICLRKGQLDLARAVVDLLRDYDDLHLVLVGTRYSAKAESHDYERDIAETFSSAGREQHLHRPGYRDDVDRWMNSADLLVHCAHQEPLGRVLLEAAASRLPMVATTVGGTSEILRPNRDAVLIPPGDHSALTRALRAAFENPSAGYQRAESAMTRTAKAFSLAAACDALGSFWQQFDPTHA